jgi:hypothetical protein
LADPRSGILLAKLQPTDANLACREIYSRNGFSRVVENPIFWARSLENPVQCPGHVFMRVARINVLQGPRTPMPTCSASMSSIATA